MCIRDSFVRAPNGSMIEFVSADGDVIAASVRSPGLRHLALTVTGFEEECKRLTAAGVKFLDPPLVKGGNKVAFFQDPEGNLLHLIERQQPLP